MALKLDVVRLLIADDVGIGKTIEAAVIARELLDRSTAAATALSPHIGYAATADIAKESIRTGKSIRQIAKERGVLSDAELERLLAPERMIEPKKK